MDSPVLNMDGCQQMEQLDLRKRRVVMATAIGRFLKRV